LNKPITSGLALIALLCACSREPAPPAAEAVAQAPPAASPAPQAAPAEVAPLAPELAARLVRPNSPVIGPPGAAVTIVEVLDPACEGCAAFAPVVREILFMHPEDVRVVVRFAAFHEGSDQAIRLLEAARRQGKFEEVLRALFDRQQEWASHHAPNVAQIWKIAADTGIDVTRARKDAAAAGVGEFLRQEAEDVIALKVARTPSFFVNSRPLDDFGARQLHALVQGELERAPRASP
jgi:protein-disulfide isomerase